MWVHFYFLTQYFQSTNKQSQFDYTYNTFLRMCGCLLIGVGAREVAVDLLFVGSNLPFGATVIFLV